MTKAQALALMSAIEARTIPADCLLRFDQAGAETWSIQLDVNHVYTGDDLNALSAYCAGHGLQLTAQFAQLGVV